MSSKNRKQKLESLKDFREQAKDSFKIEEIANFLRAQKGITQWSGLTFGIEVLDKSIDEQETK